MSAEPPATSEPIPRDPIVPEPAEPDRGVAWHLCGIGVKDGLKDQP
jgi:hypothetical protein